MIRTQVSMWMWMWMAAKGVTHQDGDRAGDGRMGGEVMEQQRGHRPIGQSMNMGHEPLYMDMQSSHHQHLMQVFQHLKAINWLG